ncbi:hypothetical protein HY386_02085 [Candidatus Daviesbacteria bacterium]|nr:hypothetical protein [Candidatus Daviesbacteria bacterium]
MFEDYKATKQDLLVIEEGINFVWNPKLKFIFADKSKIEKTVVVISYDSQFIYIWSPKGINGLDTLECGLEQYHLYKIPHKSKIKDEWQSGWCAGLLDRKIEKYLPKSIKQKTIFEVPRISGGLLTPFIELQKKRRKDNPYITRESYLATIVHEFGHVYWHQHKLWYYSNKKENLLLLRISKRLYTKGGKLPKVLIRFPIFEGMEGMSELFAFCAEYQASLIFWPTHKRNLDIFTANRIEYLLKLEEVKNLDQEDSVLEPSKYPHDFAFVFSKIILTLYPKTWPQVLIAPTPNILHIPS